MSTDSTPDFVEEVELRGHIVDSLLLPKVLDEITSRGATFQLKEMKVGQRASDASYARIEIHATNEEQLAEVLAQVHDHGAVPVHTTDCSTVTADIEACFPDGFYSSINQRTQLRLDGDWVYVEDQEMDCGILVDPKEKRARCVAMTAVKVGDQIVVGRKGVRILPMEMAPKTEMFQFMSSAVSSEKPKRVTVREIAAAIKRTRDKGEKVIAVLGPAVVHTGAIEPTVELIRGGYVQVLFAGNALATHDIERAFYGTSLGVDLHRGLPAEEGHEHHLRTINQIRRLGGIRAAVEQGKLTDGIMHACVTENVPFVLAGSIRDDGPLPEVITDVLNAQQEMRSHVPGAGLCLMVATTLHSIATGNLLPAWVKVACVDINPATVTKLMDRGSTQTIGIVSDAEPFLRALAEELMR